MERCVLAPPAAVTLRRQWDCSAKGESSPCRISLLNPLLCAGTKSTKERNQITRAALAGCATVSGPEVNSLIFPRATNWGGRSGQPGFLCKSVRWCEEERADEQRVVHHPCGSTDRRMDRCCPAIQNLSPTHAKTQHRFRGMKDGLRTNGTQLIMSTIDIWTWEGNRSLKER